MQPIWPERSSDRLSYFKSYRIGAATAYHLKNKEALIESIIDSLSLTQQDALLFCFGEVDCRGHLLKQQKIQDKPLEEIVQICVTRLLEALSHYKKYGVNIIVWGPAATWHDCKPYDGLSFGSHKERNHVTRLFNRFSAEKCPAYGFHFVSIFDKLLRDTTETAPCYLDHSGIHLTQNAMPFALDALKEQKLLPAYEPAYKGYPNKIEFIKHAFAQYYEDKGPETGILQGYKYEGASTHCTNCLCTLIKMVEARSVLEIGSWRYIGSNGMGAAMDEYYGKKGYGVIDSFDVQKGGYNGKKLGALLGRYRPTSRRVVPHFWYPYHTQGEGWKYQGNVVYKEFIDMTNDTITWHNRALLERAAMPHGGTYDIIFIDGDHSYEGVSLDFSVSRHVADENTLFVVDNIWDRRMKDVRQFFDALPYIKWDFEEWNDAHYERDMVQDTGIFILQKPNELAPCRERHQKK